MTVIVRNSLRDDEIILLFWIGSSPLLRSSNQTTKKNRLWAYQPTTIEFNNSITQNRPQSQHASTISNYVPHPNDTSFIIISSPYGMASSEWFHVSHGFGPLGHHKTSKRLTTCHLQSVPHNHSCLVSATVSPLICSLFATFPFLNHNHLPMLYLFYTPSSCTSPRTVTYFV